MELLELLAQQKHCNYISDLRFLPKSRLHFPQLQDIDLVAFSEREWIDAAWYVRGKITHSAAQARTCLVSREKLYIE